MEESRFQRHGSQEALTNLTIKQSKKSPKKQRKEKQEKRSIPTQSGPGLEDIGSSYENQSFKSFTKDVRMQIVNIE